MFQFVISLRENIKGATLLVDMVRGVRDGYVLLIIRETKKGTNLFRIT